MNLMLSPGLPLAILICELATATILMGSWDDSSNTKNLRVILWDIIIIISSLKLYYARL